MARFSTALKAEDYINPPTGVNHFLAIAPGLIRNHTVIKLFRFWPEYFKDDTIFAASAEEAYVSHDSGVSSIKL